MDIREMLCESHNWTQLSGDGVQWGGLLYIRVPHEERLSCPVEKPTFQLCILERTALDWRLTD